MKKVISAVRFKGYEHHASRAEPQHIIKSEKTDHVAIHKGQALKHIKAKKKTKPKKQEQEEGQADSGVKKRITVHYAKFVLVSNHHGCVSILFILYRSVASPCFRLSMARSVNANPS